MKKATDFARLLSGFLTNYLPNEKGVSVNTVKSYSYTFILFIKYMREIQNVPLTKLTFSLLNKKVVAEFLNWLQKERRCSAATRNQRLAAISSFIRYAEYMNPGHLDACHQILSIPAKKIGSKGIDYLNIDGIKLLLQQPDPHNPKGIRDLTLLSLMYESAARVQEIIDLTPGSMFITDKPYRVILHGKGDKCRSVPLPEKEVELLKRYLIQEGLLGNSAQSDHFISRQSDHRKLTRKL